MPFVDSADIEPWERLPGWKGRTLQSESMTFAYWDIAADAAPLPHSARALSACRAIVVEYPIRTDTPALFD